MVKPLEKSIKFWDGHGLLRLVFSYRFVRGRRPNLSSESQIRSLSPLKTSPARRAALSWRAREADRLARGTFAGRGAALKAHQTQFSADERGIHHHGVKTSTGEHCVPGAEAPAVPGELQRLGEKQRPADGAKTPGTEDEEPLFGCTCVKTPSDRTDNPQLPQQGLRRYLSHGLAAAARQPCRLGLLAPTCHTSRSILAVGVYTTQPVARRLSTVSTLVPRSSGGSWRLDGLWLSLDESRSMLPTH